MKTYDIQAWRTSVDLGPGGLPTKEELVQLGLNPIPSDLDSDEILAFHGLDEGDHGALALWGRSGYELGIIEVRMTARLPIEAHFRFGPWKSKFKTISIPRVIQVPWLVYRRPSGCVYWSVDATDKWTPGHRVEELSRSWSRIHGPLPLAKPQPIGPYGRKKVA